MRTLVVHTGGIGDFLLTCPALSLLAQSTSLDLLGYPDRLQLAVEAGIARNAYAMGSVEFDTLFSTPSRRLRSFLLPYDRCIVWMRDGDGTIRRALTRCGEFAVDIFPGLPPETWTDHASHYYLKCLGFQETPRFRLPIEPIPLVPEVDLLIHPGSGGERKNWPLEHYRQVTARLVAEGLRIGLIGGPAEKDMAVPDAVLWVRETSLVKLAGHLAACPLYLGNDSGITHLAASVGCRTVALFGPTHPALWAPTGDPVTVLTPILEAAWPTVDAVLQSLYHHLESLRRS